MKNMKLKEKQTNTVIVKNEFNMRWQKTSSANAMQHIQNLCTAHAYCISHIS